MKYLSIRSLLLNAGFILLLVGLWELLFPYNFYQSNGTTLPNTPGMTSEVRAQGGLLIGCSLLIFIGAFRRNLTRQTLILSATLYLSFGLARAFSLIIDGIPSATIIGAAIVELVVGALSVAALAHLKPKQRELPEPTNDSAPFPTSTRTPAG